MTDSSANSTNLPATVEAEHEPDGTNAGGLLLVILSLILLTVFALVSVAVGFAWLGSVPGLEGARQDWSQQRTSPGVEPNQKFDRQRLQAAEEQQLTEYGWSDAERAHAHIPIERAMKMMIDHKLDFQWPESSGHPPSNKPDSPTPAPKARQP